MLKQAELLAIRQPAGRKCPLGVRRNSTTAAAGLEL